MSLWRLIDLETNDGYTNMAIDEAILEARIEDKVPNTFRLYRWKPSCASIGRNQSMEHEVDIEACKKLGVDYVRRITGGGAVFHDFDGEITYSIVAKKENFLPMDIDETFRILCKGIIVALGDFGLNAAWGFSLPLNFCRRSKNFWECANHQTGCSTSTWDHSFTL